MIAAPLVLGLVSWIGPQERRPTSLTLDAARDATGDGLAFVEAITEKAAYFVEEPIRLTLRFGVEEAFLATRMVQPFGRSLDLPVQVVAPWIGELAGTVPLGVIEVLPDSAETLRPTFALNESVQHAARVEARVVDGTKFQVFEVATAFLPTSEGELSFPAPIVAFAYATRFEEDLVRGRAAVDRVDVFARGAPLALAIRPLPAEGRPGEFTGAVGRFGVRTSVEPIQIEMGESLKLALTVEGEGNLGRFAAPRWSEIGGFRVLGVIDERSPEVRRIVYDLAPVSEKVWQVPAISFAYFDPGPPAEYRIARTEPIEVTVRPASRAEPVGSARPERESSMRRGGTGSSPAAESGDPQGARFAVGKSDLVLGGVALLASALAAGLFVRFRARRRAGRSASKP